LTNEAIRAVLGPSVTDDEAAALADTFAGLCAALERFPLSELRPLEPPLRMLPRAEA
jgi:hypothetical protein